MSNSLHHTSQWNMDIPRPAARFQCSAIGCQSSYSSRAELQNHANHRHLFLSNPPSQQYQAPQTTVPHTGFQHTTPLQSLSPQQAQYTDAYNAHSVQGSTPQQTHLPPSIYNFSPPPTAQQIQLSPTTHSFPVQSLTTAQHTLPIAQAFNTQPTLQNTATWPANSAQTPNTTQQTIQRRTTSQQPSGLAPQVDQRMPQRTQPLRQSTAPMTGMHPPSNLRNPGHGPASTASNVSISPMTNPSTISPRLLTMQMQTNSTELTRGMWPLEVAATKNSQPPRYMWPPKAELCLKALIIKHALFHQPLDYSDQIKLSTVFKELQLTVGLDFMGMDKNDPRVLKIFAQKVVELQSNIITGQITEDEKRRAKEIARLTRINQIPTQFASSDLPNQPTTFSPLATPPHTPIIPNTPRLPTIKECWDSRDAETQSKIFCQLIQSAKDPERLTAEWDKWCNNIRGIKRQASEAFGELSSEKNAETTAKALAFTPPIDDQGQDLNSMIERGVREARLKKRKQEEMDDQKIRQKAEEEASIKRMEMIDP